MTSKQQEDISLEILGITVVKLYIKNMDDPLAMKLSDFNFHADQPDCCAPGVQGGIEDEWCSSADMGRSMRIP